MAVTGIGKDTISRLFNPPHNHTKIPQVTTIDKVCQVFEQKGIDVDFNYVYRGKKREDGLISKYGEETILKCIDMLNGILHYADGEIRTHGVTDNRNDNTKLSYLMKSTSNLTLGFSVRSLSYKSAEDKYIISSGSIYRIVNGESYPTVSIDSDCLMKDDFVERLKSQYRKKRPFLGNISILSTNQFIWLAIIIALAENTVAV